MRFLLSFILSSPLCLAAQNAIYSTIHSSALKEERKIWISLPQYYDLRKDSFHVIYVLGANNKSLFDLTVASKRFLEKNAVDLNDFNTPEAIIVGVEQRNCGIDFADSAAAFLRFLTGELMPMINSEYRTVPYNILIGHSLAGRFAIFSLINKPRFFNAVITASPALNGFSLMKIFLIRTTLTNNAPIYFNTVTDLAFILFTVSIPPFGSGFHVYPS
jgi:predicted alpha/beta superfamily hydrolase